MTTFQPDLPSILKEQRLTEELASAQKKVKEYEDLLLYHNACEHCKACFQRFASTGASHASKSGLPATAVATLSSVSNYPPHTSSPSTQPVPHHTLKRQQISLSEPTTSHVLKRPRISPPGNSITQHGATTSRICAPKASSSQLSSDGAPRHGPPGDKPTRSQYSVKFPVGKPKLKVERVWTFDAAGKYGSVVRFSPDGKYLAVGLVETPNHLLKTYIYDLTTERKICLADRYPLRKRNFGRYLSFSPGDGRYLATAHWSSNTMIWEVGKKRVRNTFSCPAVETCADFSPDGRFIVIGSLYGVYIRSMRDGSSICLGYHDGIAAVKFSPDGKLVLAADLDGMLRLWNVRTSKMVGKWKAHQNAVSGVAFTPNGRGLVTSSTDQNLKYWDLGLPGVGGLRNIADSEVSKFVGHIGHVCSVAISPNGRWLVSGSGDYGTARIWDMIDASPQCMLGGLSGVRSVDFCPTSDYVACGYEGGNVSVWRYRQS